MTSRPLARASAWWGVAVVFTDIGKLREEKIGKRLENQMFSLGYILVRYPSGDVQRGVGYIK